MDYLELLGRLHAAVRPQAYLEVGTETGAALALSRSRSVAIDPRPLASAKTLLGKPWAKVFTMTSDEFFQTHTQAATLEGHPLDLAVIDGWHEFTQVVRDLENIERWAHPETIVVIHDVLPENSWQATRTWHEGAWTGDVWRIVPFLREHRPDLSCHLVGVPPAGALIVTGLDPEHQGMSEIAADLDRTFPDDGPDYERLVDSWLASANPTDPVGALRSLRIAPRTVDVQLEGVGWSEEPEGWVPQPRVDKGRIRIVPAEPVRACHRGRIVLNARGMQVLRIRFHYAGEEGQRYRDLFLDVSHPGAVYHGLDSLWLDADPESGQLEIDWESRLGASEVLRAITVVPVDIWFREVPLDPGMAVALNHVEIQQKGLPRTGTRFVAARFPNRPRADKGSGGKRDAVIFAWWLPRNKLGRDVGEYYRGLLRYHHPDSKIFLAIDSRSDPVWTERFARSGLDVEIVTVDPVYETGVDIGGLLAALGAFSRCPEEFDLVWVGHTKGASFEQSEGDSFSAYRYQQDREFWARRADIEGFFADPKIGLFAPRYGSYAAPYYSNSVPGRAAAEIDALMRVYRDDYAPLGIWTRDATFVTRGKIIRRFCDRVGEELLRYDPRELGAGRWFFEAAFPSIASMQGYEPLIETGVSGGAPSRTDFLLYGESWKANRLAMEELGRWREDPLTYRAHRRVLAGP